MSGKGSANAAGVRQYKRYPMYKDSGVEWLGEIPEQWEVRVLKRSALKIQTGTTPPTEELRYYDDGTIPWYGPGSFGEELTLRTPTKYISQSAIQEGAAREFKAGTCAIVTIGATIGKAALMDRTGSFNQQITGVVFDENDIYCRFGAYQLKSFEIAIRGTAPNTTLPIVDQDQIGSISTVIPPLSEQRIIASFLDYKTAKIDALLQKNERLIGLLQEKRAALITQAVTKGMDPNSPMKDSGIEWIGKIPLHWNIAPLYARYEVALGKMLDTKRISGKFSGRYIRNIDVQWDFVNTDDLPEMDFAPDERERYGLKVGDLLVCEGGEVGRTAIWRGEIEDCFYQKAIHRVRPRLEEESPRFFYYLMYSYAKRGVFAASGNPNTIDHLTAVELRRFRFPFAGPEEQRAIASFLDQETAKLDALIAKAREAIERLKELRIALISAAVTGKIDVREEVP